MLKKIIFKFEESKNLGNLTWQGYGPYSFNDINTIKELNSPTSIPSPFARFKLFETSFSYVVENGINGDSIFHKLVSQCLDFYELKFLNETKLIEPEIKVVDYDITENNQPKSLTLFKNINPEFGLNKFKLYYFNDFLLGADSPFSLSIPIINIDNFNISIDEKQIFQSTNSLNKKSKEFIEYFEDNILKSLSGFHIYETLEKYCESCKRERDRRIKFKLNNSKTKIEAFQSECQDLIAAYNIDELFVFFNNKLNKNSDIYSQSILMESKYSKYKKDMRIGVMSISESEVINNRLLSSLVELVNLIKESDITH